MKRFIIVLLIVSCILMVGCSTKEPANDSNDVNASVNTDNSFENKENDGNTDNISDDVTIESVKKAKATDESLFEYEAVDGGVAITGYIGEEKIISIPDTIADENVVAIADYAFTNNEKIKAVKLSDSVKSIGECAFGNCCELQVFVSGSSLESIGEYAFNYCQILKDVELNDGLKVLDMGCFNITAITRIEIPSSVETFVMPLLGGGNDVTIVAESGSPAEAYANGDGAKYGLVFEAK